MPDQPDLPALSDDYLRETLDLMATAVASMSDRIDDLTAVADKQIKVAREARIAAFAARDQTNPKKYGDLLGQTLDSHLGATADAMTEIVRHLLGLIGNIPPAVAEQNFYAQRDVLDMVA